MGQVGSGQGAGQVAAVCFVSILGVAAWQPWHASSLAGFLTQVGNVPPSCIIILYGLGGLTNLLLFLANYQCRFSCPTHSVKGSHCAWSQAPGMCPPASLLFPCRGPVLFKTEHGRLVPLPQLWIHPPPHRWVLQPKCWVLACELWPLTPPQSTQAVSVAAAVSGGRLHGCCTTSPVGVQQVQSLYSKSVSIQQFQSVHQLVQLVYSKSSPSTSSKLHTTNLVCLQQVQSPYNKSSLYKFSRLRQVQSVYSKDQYSPVADSLLPEKQATPTMSPWTNCMWQQYTSF